MKLQEAISFVENRDDRKKLGPVIEIFQNHLRILSKDAHQKRGLAYYYILRLILRTHMFYENEETLELYENMTKEFLEEGKKRPSPAFYKLMERVYGSLEVIYDKKDFMDAQRRAYEQKMDYRKSSAFYDRHLWEWIELAFLKLTSRYGHSFLRWGATGLVFALFCAVLYYFIDLNVSPAFRTSPGLLAGDYIYFSIVTFTTLGFGDITPQFWASRLVSGVEVFAGFILLGMFIHLLQKRL